MLALGGAMTMGQQDAKTKVIEAQEFRVVDEEGRKLATLGSDQGGGRHLVFFDLRGKPRAALGTRIGDKEGALDGVSSALYLSGGTDSLGIRIEALQADISVMVRETADFLGADERMLLYPLAVLGADSLLEQFAESDPAGQRVTITAGLDATNLEVTRVCGGAKPPLSLTLNSGDRYSFFCESGTELTGTRVVSD